MREFTARVCDFFYFQALGIAYYSLREGQKRGEREKEEEEVEEKRGKKSRLTFL